MKKMLILAAPLALTLAVGGHAQTIPAENWVGPPISTVGGQLSRSEVQAEMARSSAQTQAPAQQWVGSTVSAGLTVGAVRRSEVLADFNLFERAGLRDYPPRAYYDPLSLETKRRVTSYRRMREGPEFLVEVARIEGAHFPAIANAAGSYGSAD
ncbi:hypothetical protein WKW80_35350 [Variovorax humicola]|uniref:DUF4148 domain-containing protein n=1 Tax=Variovorax humicola TaxID=1769758 RepID=A0ABU8WBA1_9BURK